MSIFTSVWRWLTGRKADDEAHEPDTQVVEESRTVLLDDVAPQGLQKGRSSDTGLPGFRASAADRPARADSLSHEARLALNEAFTPSQPVTERRRFAGRLEVLVRLISGLEDQRAHVVLYGERGIGKTSLVHVLTEIARESRYHVAYASCGAGSHFDDIFRGVMRDIPSLYASSVDPASSQNGSAASLADLLPQGRFDARQLGDLCATITGTRVLIILDEYDRTEDSEFRQQVAELIKNLSDRAARVQLVIAGVAGNLQELVGYIPSIRRNIIGLPVPRLERKEVEALVALGEEAAGMRFAADATDAVDKLSYGSPYLARLVCHRAGLTAINAGRLEVGLADIRDGLNDIVHEAEHRLGTQARAHLADIILPGQEALAGALALAAHSPDGWFTLADALMALGEETPSPALSQELERFQTMGLISTSGDAGARRYRFPDEALAFYLWMATARRTFEQASPRQNTRAVA